MGRGIRVHNRTCWLNSLISPSLRTTILSGLERSITLNLTLIAAVTMLLVWLVLVFILQVPSGAVHLFYAGGVILIARRMLIGAPRFVS
jgi:hypothetical protein